MQAFLLGALLGLTIAVPVGPMALLAVQHTLTRGLRHGLASALGAATGDTLYAIAAALGLSLVAASVVAHEAVLRLIGGALLLGLGALAVRELRGDLPDAAPAPVASAASAYAAGLLLTVTNPITIVTFGAILLHARAIGPAPLIAGGTFVGSFLWYAALCAAAHRLRARLQRRLRHVQLATVGGFWLGGALSIATAAAELWRRG